VIVRLISGHQRYGTEDKDAGILSFFLSLSERLTQLADYIISMYWLPHSKLRV
jgi:hypothetical protein